MTLVEETWRRIDQANVAAGWFGEWTVAERDQIEALADELNAELLSKRTEFSSAPRPKTLYDINAAHWQHMREVDERAKAIGWKHVDSSSCPRRLVGKRCRGTKCWCGNGSSGNCFRDLDDHGATWLCEKHWGPHQRKFVLWEPYAARGEYLAEVIRVANEDGLEVWLTASTWNPPHTVGIMFYPKDAN